MRIRSIHLQNVRRFAEPVEIAGIGDGLNVLTAPNERGKSTIFDALHAVFFKSSRAWDKEVRSLVPHAGGDPSVAVEIEMQEGLFRIEKSWNKSRSGIVRVLFDGVLLKQADDAHDWIAEALKSPKDGGPAGLLWVRQGQFGIDDGSAGNKARRDLLSSVAGEVEAVTGGRRMDMARDFCGTELEKYVTGSGRIKAGGPLKTITDKVGSLDERVADLQGKSNQLRDELARRRELRRSLGDLEAPEQIEERRKRILEAENELQEARLHNEKLERAKETKRKVEATLHQSADRLHNLRGGIQELATARNELESLACTERLSREEARNARSALTTAEHARSSAKERNDMAVESLNAVLERVATMAAAEHRRGLEANLKAAERHRQEAESCAAKAKAEITAKGLAMIERLDGELQVRRTTREKESAFVRMTYSPDRAGSVNLEDGTELTDGQDMPIPDGVTLSLDGLGSLAINPGKATDRDQLEGLEARLVERLKKAGHGTVASAMASDQRRRDAEQGARDARSALDAVAPDGIEALRDRLAKMPKSADMRDDLPDREDAERIVASSRRDLESSDETLARRRTQFDEMNEKATIAIEKVRGATGRVKRAERSLAAYEDPEGDVHRLETRVATLKIQLADAERESGLLSEDAPNLGLVEAKLERARSALARAESERSQVRTELSALDTRIELRAGEAIEEELEDAKSLREAARKELSAVQFEVDVLRRLKTELETASASARDQYVRPVVNELQPLVRILWPEAELHLDAENVLPQSLVRAGTPESFDVLSGGTKEQIALLVRLAFARLLAKGGSPAPVILDDAIVFSDDDRIEQMFDALTKQAQDLQIIVMSCRQRAFRDLGGQSLTIRSVMQPD